MNHHSHVHGVERLRSLNAGYYIAIILNLTFVAAELTAGIAGHSMGLLSDAGHKALDVCFLLLALLGFKLAQSRPGRRYTYGLRKSSVLIALFNAIILLGAVAVIAVESIDKFYNPAEVDGSLISWTAAAGILVSGISASLLMRGRDINTRSAFLHQATDALLSVGVVVSGIVISLTGWTFIDPAVSLVIAAVVFYNTLRLLVRSFRMSVDAVPEGIDYDDVTDAILSVDGVRTVSELHIWPVSIVDTALTAKIVVEGDIEETVGRVRHALDCKSISLMTIEARRV